MTGQSAAYGSELVGRTDPLTRHGRGRQLTREQSRAWFLHRWRCTAACPNVVVVADLAGTGGSADTVAALDTVLNHDPDLLVAIDEVAWRPRWEVAPAPVSVDRIATEGDASGQGGDVWRYAREQLTIPLRWERPPLLRAAIADHGGARQSVVLTCARVLGGGQALLRIVGRLVEALHSGAPRPAPPPPAISLRHLPGETLAWWHGRCGDPLTLTTDYPRPLVHGLIHHRVALAVPPLRQGTHDWAGAGVEVLALAALTILLNRHLRLSPVPVLILDPAADDARTGPDVPALEGELVGLAAVAAAAGTVRSYLGRVASELAGAYRHRAPLAELVAQLRTRLDPAYHPLAQAGLRVARPRVHRRGDLVCVATVVAPESTALDIELTVDLADPVRMWLSANASLFTEATAAGLATQLTAVLAELVANPSADVARVDGLGRQERSRILRLSRGQPAASSGECVHEAFARQAAATPHAVAVACGDRRLSYAQLDSRANQLARYLRRAGTVAQRLVPVCLPQDVELPVALLGVLKTGAAYVPLDPEHAGVERTRQALDQLAEPTVVTSSNLRTVLPLVGDRVICLDTDEQAIAAESTDPLEPVAYPGDLAYVIFTSGTSGRPKGVMVDHGALLNYLRWCAGTYFDLGGQGSLVLSSVAFDLTVTSLLGPLLCGQQVLLPPPEADLSEVGDLLRQVRGLSAVKLTPTLLDLLVAELGPELAGVASCLVVGGETLTSQSVRDWLRYDPATVVVNEYGPTEACVGNVTHRVGASEPASGGTVPIGLPIPGTEAYVLDQDLRLVPVGVVGELYLGGSCLARGYLGRAALTAERFVPHPFQSGGRRLYRTGDLARWRPDGVVEYVGRRDSQLKLRGFRIEPAEVESALASHPAVERCVVTLRQSPTGRPALAAHVSVSQGDAPDADLLAFVARKLPPYLVPSVIVRSRHLPTAANGKLDRGLALQQPAAEGRRHAEDITVTEDYALVVEAWRQALGIEGSAAEDDFFRVGGDSAAALELVERLRRSTGVDLPVEVVFTGPTLGAIAAELRTRRLAAPGWTSGDEDETCAE